jgi:lysozyme
MTRRQFIGTARRQGFTRRQAARSWRAYRWQRRGVSRRGVRFVARFEGGVGLIARPYYDRLGGVWTIGYGHTQGVTANTRPWSRRKARRVLRRDLNEQYAVYVRALGLPLGQASFDALVSFVYNLGPGAIGTGTGIGAALRAGRYRHAADQILRWDRAAGRPVPGLTRRRRAERRLFLKGI